MAIGKLDYNWYMDPLRGNGTHYCDLRGSAVPWQKVDWEKYDKGNFEDTIKNILEQAKNRK
jgi:hypothetical protein